MTTKEDLHVVKTTTTVDEGMLNTLMYLSHCHSVLSFVFVILSANSFGNSCR